MPNNQYIERNVAICKKNFFGMIDYPYLQKYIEPPKVDEDKIRFLYSMLYSVIPKEELEVYALAAMLVDASLNTHDRVSLNKINSDFVKKNRQLTVLGGDYYSSLYYRLLSENDYVPMIHLFALSIQTINEYKMVLYNNEYLSYDEVKESVANIESALLVNMANFYEMAEWVPVIKEFFFLKRFLNETEEMLISRKKPIIRAVFYERFGNKYRLETNADVEALRYACEYKIEETKETLITNLRNLAINPTFIDRFLEKQLRVKEKVAEEG